MLISAAELNRSMTAQGCVVVDCRFDLSRPGAGENAYLTAHIPGARYGHLDRDLSALRFPGSGRHPLPEPEKLAGLFSSWGITAGVQVVAYDDAGGAIAARLWWLLRWLGHDRVALLDGGWQSWLGEGLAVSTSLPVPAGTVFEGIPGRMPVTGTNEIESRLQDARLLLLDVRAAPRYRGEVEPIDPVAGHIPGARNLPFTRSLDDRGRFRAPAVLAEGFQPLLGGHDISDVVVMCGSGVTACHSLFAMELAGFSGARLYPGSWSEWVADPHRPVERG